MGAACQECININIDEQQIVLEEPVKQKVGIKRLDSTVSNVYVDVDDCESDEQNLSNKYFWVDSNIYCGENQKYYNSLKKDVELETFCSYSGL